MLSAIEIVVVFILVVTTRREGPLFQEYLKKPLTPAEHERSALAQEVTQGLMWLLQDHTGDEDEDQTPS